jgi:hypothetical protein
MSISAAEASRLTGKSKQAIINAIKLGKISAIKDLDGAWQIEPVELFRVYTPLSTLDTKLDTTISQELDGTSQALDTPSVATLLVEVRMLRELLDAKDDTIADLRTRLDVEQEERRRLSMLLAAPQPELPVPVEQPPPARPRSWWSRLLGG